MSQKHQNPAYSYKGEKPSPLPDVPPRSRARKDTRAWCKGRAGREHVTEIQPFNPWFPNSGVRACGQSPHGSWFSCYHREVCVVCGKHVRRIRWAQCPENPLSTPVGVPDARI